jgi:DNA-binding IclR family transcriptional regulator
MSSLSRMLAILDLFTEAAPTLSADDIIARLGYSRPTGYRYVRELVAAGLLVRAAGGYSLGPRIIELDWHIRRFDPVLAVSRPIVHDLAARSGCNVTQMSMYGERIVTIHHEPGAEPLEINFGRGRPMPLFRGAPSRAILAFLPRARLKRLYERYRDEAPPEVRRLGFEGFAQKMQEVRRAGYAVSHGELDADKVGVAAPLRIGQQVCASLCLIMTTVRYSTANQKLLAEMVMDSARRISRALELAEPERGRKLLEPSTRSFALP